MRAKKLIAVGIILVLGMTTLLEAQRRGRRGGMFGIRRPDHIEWNSDFTFCRLAYREAYDGDGGGWGVDYPRADINLPIRLSELTRALVNFDSDREPNHVVIQATEPELFKCPFVMITEVGATFFDENEAKALRQYLEKGGFMWADDFWGEYAWRHWERELRKVLPAAEYPIIDVPMTHSIFHTLFDAKRFPQIPSIGWVYSGTTSERGPDSATPHARAVVDQKGRIIVFISHNTDFGDAFEREGESRDYFDHFAADGYAVGINVILYALTH
jgi:hypothetical protein